MLKLLYLVMRQSILRGPIGNMWSAAVARVPLFTGNQQRSPVDNDRAVANDVEVDHKYQEVSEPRIA